MKTLVVCASLLVTIGALTLTHAADVAPAHVAPAAAQFSTQFRLTALKDGKRIVLAEPNVVTADGQQGSCLIGGEVPVDAETKDVVHFGITARVKVCQEAGDKLHVSMYLGHGELDAQSASNFVVREQGVHCVRTVKPGDTIEIDLGEGRIATFSVNLMVVKK